MSKPNHREKILLAGYAVFHEQGFHNSGVQDVVDYAGVPKGSFYNHFKSKEALGLEVMEYVWEGGDQMRAELKAEGVSAIERIDRHIAAAGYDKNGCLIGNFSSELAVADKFRSRLKEMYNMWISEVADCIKEGQKDGTVRNDDPAKNMAEFIVEGIEGAKLKAKVELDPAVIKRFRKSIRLFLSPKES